MLKEVDMKVRREVEKDVINERLRHVSRTDKKDLRTLLSKILRSKLKLLARVYVDKRKKKKQVKF